MSKIFVPEPIIRGFRHGESSGRLEGLVVVFDIAGFTGLTRGFMLQGRRGAEAISNIIKDTISPAVETVESAGAFVAGFAGDSFVAVFPVTVPEIPSAPVEECLNWALGQLAGRFAGLAARRSGPNLIMRVGVSLGEVSWTIVEHAAQSVFFFHGEGLERAHRTCAECAPERFCFDISAHAMLPKVADHEMEGAAGCLFQIPYRVFKDHSACCPGVPRSAADDVPEIQSAFVGTGVSELNSGGELRDVVVGMVSFHPDYQFTRCLPRLIDLVHNFGGHLNKIDWGDKGALALVIFGAPLALDHMPERAASFFQAVIEEQGQQVRWGTTLGTVFTGLVGSEIRCEYTALGDVVNLAARLMARAEWGEILADSTVAKVLEGRPMRAAGALSLKGYDIAIEAFQLLPDLGGIFRPAAVRKFCGREEEAGRIMARLEGLASGNSHGVIYLAASAGMGKSSLIGEVRCRYLRENDQIWWLTMPCDQVLRKTFSPFKRSLGELMGLNLHDAPENNLRRLRSFIDLAVVKAKNPAITDEAERIHEYLPHFLGISGDLQMPVFIDEKARYENTLQCVKSLFLAMASDRPVVLVVEDFQWADQDSRILLERLCEWGEPTSILIIATCRCESISSVPKLAVSGIESETVWLSSLLAEESASLLEATLASTGRSAAMLTPSLAKFVHERGQGNPFYMEQILLYMLDNRLIEEGMNVGSGEFPVPPGINMLITARLDRLEKGLRRTVATAAVLGVEFHSGILSQICSEANLPGKLKRGETEGLWIPGPIPEYLFSHGLIRDAAYNMQLSESLRKTHLAAGVAYESVFGDNPIPVLPELANHFEKANEWKKAMRYLQMAGENALKQYQNAAAVAFFDRWVKLAHRSGDASPPFGRDFNLIDALNLRGAGLRNDGSWEEALQSFSAALGLSDKAGDRPRELTSLINLGDIHRFRGAYADAMDLRLRALKLAEDLGDLGAVATVYGNIGNIHLCLNNLDEALNYYRRQESIARKSGSARELSISVGNTGIVFSKRGDLMSAMSCYTEQLELCVSLNDIRGMAIAVGNIGLVLRRRGDFGPALEQFRKQLDFARQSGDKQLICNAIGNLGVIALDRLDLVSARENFERQRALAEELGDRRTLAYACGMLGNTLEKMGEIPKAKASFEKKLLVSEELDYQPGIASARSALKKLSEDYRGLSSAEE